MFANAYSPIFPAVNTPISLISILADEAILIESVDDKKRIAQGCKAGERTSKIALELQERNTWIRIATKLLKTAHLLYCGGVACHDTKSVRSAVGLAEVSPRAE
jgi:hypothetical protein